jgi:hypothetical protein
MNEPVSDLKIIEDNNINRDKFYRTKNSMLIDVIKRTFTKIGNIETQSLEIQKKIMFQNGLSPSGIDKIMDNVVEAYSNQISQTNMFTLAGSDFVENVLDKINSRN